MSNTVPILPGNLGKPVVISFNTVANPHLCLESAPLMPITECAQAMSVFTLIEDSGFK